MKVRIHTYQVQRVAYDVEVASPAEVEEVVWRWYEEGADLGEPVAQDMDDEVRPYVLIDPLMENGDVDYAASGWLTLEEE